MVKTELPNPNIIGIRKYVDTLLKEVATVHSGFEVEHLATVAGLVEQGLGISLVPELTLFQFRQLDPARNPPRRATDPGGEAQGPGTFHCGPGHAGPGGQTPEHESRGAETRLTGRDHR
jgi:DNA-binding transcriptional LysR family regulator